jgi:hypothetical protein
MWSKGILETTNIATMCTCKTWMDAEQTVKILQRRFYQKPRTV